MSSSLNRPLNTFGFNIKVPTRTLEQAGETLGNLAKAPGESVLNYFEKNENVFSGDVYKEIKKTEVQCMNTGRILGMAEEQTKGNHSFDMDM